MKKHVHMVTTRESENKWSEHCSSLALLKCITFNFLRVLCYSLIFYVTDSMSNFAEKEGTMSVPKAFIFYIEDREMTTTVIRSCT